MMQRDLVETPQWDAIRKYLVAREQHLKEMLLKRTQTFDDTQVLRGQVVEIRRLLKWVQGSQDVKGERNARRQ